MCLKCWVSTQNCVAPLYFLGQKCCGSLGIFLVKLEVDPTRYGSFGSYVLLVNNLDNEMIDKWIIENINEISW